MSTNDVTMNVQILIYFLQDIFKVFGIIVSSSKYSSYKIMNSHMAFV